MDLNLLLGLDALLSERNVTRAATRMSVGQSAMSATLGRLRRHFGDPLLVREGHALSLTPLAEALRPLVQEAVQAARDVFEKPRGFDPLADRRSFTIMASDYTTLILLRQLIARLADVAPLQRINVAPSQRPGGAARLSNGEADVMIVPSDMIPSGAVVGHRHLFTDRFILAADRGGNVGEAVTREQFSQLPYIAYSGGPYPSLPDSQLDALNVIRRVEMTTESYVVMPFLVAGTKLVALIPERLTRHLAGYLDLVVTEPPVPLRPLSETMIWHPRQTDDPAHSWLRAQIAEQAALLDH